MNDYSWLKKAGTYDGFSPGEYAVLVRCVRFLSEKLNILKPPRFMGEGVSQTAWELSNNRVLKLYTCDDVYEDYEDSKAIRSHKFPWSKHEPLIYDLGHCDCTLKEKMDNRSLKWVIMEKFLVPEIDILGEEVDDVLFSLTSSIEDSCEELGRNIEERGIKDMDKETYSKIVDLSSKVSKGIARGIRMNSERLDAIFVIQSYFKLKSDWLEELILDMAYKTKTGRYGDLHPQNLGFSIDSRQPIFFDW